MARPVGILDKKGRYTKNSIFAAVMAQLEYWQAIEDGARLEEVPKKKSKKKKKAKKKAKAEKVALELANNVAEALQAEQSAQN